MLRKFRGEILSFDFCFADRGEADAFAAVVEYCCRHGAKPDKIQVHRFPNARTAEFPAEGSFHQVRVSVPELTAVLHDADARVGAVSLWNAIGVSRDPPEIIESGNAWSHEFGGYLWQDGAPIRIESEGSTLSPELFSKGDVQRAEKKCFRRFHDVCSELDPAYAAVFVEMCLPGIEELKRGSYKDAEAFHDFYVSGTVFGPRILNRIEDKFAGAYTERVGNGLLVSSTGVFNPEGMRLDWRDVQERSKSVARLLRSAL